MTEIAFTLPYAHLCFGEVRLVVAEERVEATRDALAILEGVRLRQWEANIRSEQAGIVHKRA